MGLDQAATVCNYFVGDQSTWRSAVPTFEKVAYQGLYDGIDLYTWGQRDNLKYEFHVAPGADYRQIEVQYEGADGLSLDAAGNLHVQTSLGDLVERMRRTSINRSAANRSKCPRGSSWSMAIASGSCSRAITIRPKS